MGPVESAVVVHTADDDNNKNDPVGRRVLVTSERLLFWGDDSSKSDLQVPAACIELHAITQDPASVYIQIMLEQEELLELTVESTDSQALFHGLSELVSLHPINPNDNNGMEMMMQTTKILMLMIK